MAKKPNTSTTHKPTEKTKKVENTEIGVLLPNDESVITESIIADNAKTHIPLKSCTIKELLELTEVSLILGKKYENLTIAEGQLYFHKKQEYNDFYNKIITELERRIEYYL
jgi:hypothetical protein